MKKITPILCMLIGIIAGYIYGYGAYNRPIRWWQFWEK